MDGPGPTALERLSDARWDVVVAPPGAGPGFWTGAPSAVAVDDGFVLAYRVRRPVGAGRGFGNVLARSADGVHVDTVGALPADRFGAASLERPALVRRPDGGWRLYVSCAVPGTKQWWVEALDTRPGGAVAELAGPDVVRTVVLPVGPASAWKDVVVHHDPAGWRMWACEHLLDGGDDEADRMRSVYLTSDDGLGWTSQGICLAPTAGSWDGRGVRVTSVWRSGDAWLATYDGRASAVENWHERTGLAVGTGPERFTPIAGPYGTAGSAARYAAVLPTPSGTRIYLETARPDGSHELRTTLVA